MSTQDSFEVRIKRIKQQRETLVSDKAEKVARLKNAQEELKLLKEEALAQGYQLNEIPTLLPKKREELDAKITKMESALKEVEEHLAKYND